MSIWKPSIENTERDEGMEESVRSHWRSISIFSQRLPRSYDSIKHLLFTYEMWCFDSKPMHNVQVLMYQTPHRRLNSVPTVLCKKLLQGSTRRSLHDSQSLLLLTRRLHLIVQPRYKPHTWLVDQLSDHLRHPQRKRQQNQMRGQKAGFQAQWSGLGHRKCIDQKRRVDFMFRSIPACCNV